MPLDYFKNTKILDIAAGSTFSIFITANREVFSCGLNDFLQIGMDRTLTIVEKRPHTRPLKRVSSPGALEFSIPNKLDYFSDSFVVKAISCGENHSIASVEYHHQTLFVGWGMNKNQQLGVEHCVSTTPRTITNLQRAGVKQVIHSVTQICCGSATTMCLTGQTGQPKTRARVREFLEALQLWRFRRI